jgi:hypothetical protein
MRNDLDIRDEEILLLGLCRLTFGVELKVMLTALAESVTDWNYFFRLANAHGVAALVSNNLEKTGLIKLLPAEVAAQLKNAQMASLARNSSYADAMGGVLRLLNPENIKVVLLKGLALELTAYGNIGLRQMTDVDVLVRKEDCLKARKILIDNGFESLPLKSAFHKPIMLYNGKHLPALLKDGFAVELHHELFGRRNVLTRMLFDTSTEAVAGDEKCFIPTPQIFFLYLVKHLYLHEQNNESRLKLYADLLILLEKHGEEILNYDLLEYAGRAGMSEILARRLEPLRDLCGISFPGWINEFIDKWYHPDAINKFVFFLKNPTENLAPGRRVRHLNELAEIPGLHRKILYILGEIFPSISFMKKRYTIRSTFSAVMCYPLRWINVI